MKYIYLILLYLIVCSSGCSTFERYKDQQDRGQKYPLEITSYTKINEEQVYGKKIFIMSDPNIENKILSSNTRDKIAKLLKIKAKHLNYDKRYKKMTIDVVEDQSLADYLLYFNFEIKQTGTEKISNTNGIQLGSSTTQVAGVVKGRSRHFGTQYNNQYIGNTDHNYQFINNINSIFANTFKSQTKERSMNVYGQEIYIALIDAIKDKSKNNIEPLWIGKINVTSYKKEMKGLADILIIAGIIYLGQDMDINIDYYSKDARLNQIIAYLYTKKRKQ